MGRNRRQELTAARVCDTRKKLEEMIAIAVCI